MGDMLRVTPGQSATDRALAEVITHFKCVMSGMNSSNLQKPFFALINAANSMQVRYTIVSWKYTFSHLFYNI